jgi:hypothetical protein
MKKITLSLSGLPDLEIYQIPDGADDFVQRSTVDVVGVGEQTLVGVDTVNGSGKPYFVWSISACVSEDEALLFDEMRSRQQTLYESGQNGAILLQDERFYVAGAEKELNQRSPISTTATSWGTKHYISCPVFLRVPQTHAAQLAEDMWLLSFDAKELVA